MLASASLTILPVLFSSTAYATTWGLARFAASDPRTDTNNGRTIFYDAGTAQVLATMGLPASLANYDKYDMGENFGDSPLDIDNISPSSNFAIVTYTSPTTGRFIRHTFHQVTNGNIRLVWTPSDSKVNPTVIATGLPVGTPLAAFHHTDSAGNQVIVVQYGDENGLLTQCISNTDAGNWSAPVTVTT
ncbi:hypothetical protein K439DRAFT_1619014 [Ramaria rubella]|nr:hypothetical protein K439DRAFT_1619014 [Ramaria rubella]